MVGKVGPLVCGGRRGETSGCLCRAIEPCTGNIEHRDTLFLSVFEPLLSCSVVVCCCGCRRLSEQRRPGRGLWAGSLWFSFGSISSGRL